MTAQNPDRGDALTDLKYVGPATAEIIVDADFDAEDFRDKRVSYRMLVEAGANPGVATKIRREHSLPWSITGSTGEDLDKRSDQVRGLQDEERAWVAASSGDWTTDDADGGDATASTSSGSSATSATSGSSATSASSGSSAAEADGSGEAEDAEAAWRERSKPDPVTEVDGVTEDVADRLANAGITSVRSLATADPESVADVLGFEEERVAEWVEDATRMG